MDLCVLSQTLKLNIMKTKKIVIALIASIFTVGTVLANEPVMAPKEVSSSVSMCAILETRLESRIRDIFRAVKSLLDSSFAMFYGAIALALSWAACSASAKRSRTASTSISRKDA